MKILQVLGSNGSAFAGTERMVNDLCTYLSREGHEVLLAVGTGCPIDSSEYRVVKLPLSDDPVSILRFSYGVRRLARELSPHVVHGHLTFGLAATCFSVWGEKTPVIYTEHIITGRGKYSLATALVKKQLLRRSVPVAVSRPVADALNRASGVVPAVVLNGADAVYPRSSRRTRDIREPIRILWCGRVSREKRLQLAIRAIGQLVQRLQVRMTVLGDGPELPECIRMVEDLGLQNSVIFEGWVNRVGDYYANSDLLIMTSSEESMSYAVLDALNSGLPIVVTKSVGAADLVLDEHRGVALSPDADHVEWAEAIRSVVLGYESYLDQAAVNKIRRTTSDMGQGYLQTYKRLVRESDGVKSGNLV